MEFMEFHNSIDLVSSFFSDKLSCLFIHDLLHVRFGWHVTDKRILSNCLTLEWTVNIKLHWMKFSPEPNDWD